MRYNQVDHTTVKGASIMIKSLVKTGLGIALISVVSLNAYADTSNMSSSSNGQSMSQSTGNPAGSGRMSAGGGVQPTNQYSDGGCQGNNCPDEGMQIDKSGSSITNTDNIQDEGNDYN
jgi:hypothetical protein